MIYQGPRTSRPNSPGSWEPAMMRRYAALAALSIGLANTAAAAEPAPAGHALLTLEVGGWKPDRTTAAVAEYLLLRNKDLDHWRAISDRPPSEASPFTTSYLAVRALQTFGTAGQKGRIDERIRAARGWLVKTPAGDTEDHVFRLWALKRVGADAGEVRAAAGVL